MLRILFENVEIPFSQKSDIEKCISNKLNDEIIDSYFKLLERWKTDVISFRSFLFHDLCNSKSSSLLKIYLKYEHLLEKRFILFQVNHKNQHWLLIVIYPQCKVIALFDSINSTSQTVQEIVKKFDIPRNIQRMPWLKFWVKQMETCTCVWYIKATQRYWLWCLYLHICNSSY